MPPETQWPHRRVQVRQSTIGLILARATPAIEHDNPTLKDVLPHDYARRPLDKRRLRQLIVLISNIRLGVADARSRDVLGCAYDYFLSQFASAAGTGSTILAAALQPCLCSRRVLGIRGVRVPARRHATRARSRTMRV